MASAAAPSRLDAIDMVKGCAILWVLLIHSQALSETHPRFFIHVVNQAVPVFVVLFGLNSELWWRRRERGALGEWYAGRARRILVPMWAALPVWWALALYYRPLGVTLTRTLALWQVAGYLAEVGTGWFITMIIQLVVVFPLLHAAARRWRSGPLLLLGLAATLACVGLQYRIMAAFRDIGPLPGGPRQESLNYFVFAPRFFVHVALGILLAPFVRRLGLGAGALALAAFLACVAAARGALAPVLAPYGNALTGLPLTVLLLSLFNLVPRVPLLTAALAWLGQSSYGLYVGQLLTHNAFVFGYGLTLYAELNLWLYTLALLAGALLFVCLGETLLRVAAALRRGGVALPSVAR